MNYVNWKTAGYHHSLLFFFPRCSFPQIETPLSLLLLLFLLLLFNNASPDFRLTPPGLACMSYTSDLDYVVVHIRLNINDTPIENCFFPLVTWPRPPYGLRYGVPDLIVRLCSIVYMDGFPASMDGFGGYILRCTLSDKTRCMGCCVMCCYCAALHCTALHCTALRYMFRASKEGCMVYCLSIDNSVLELCFFPPSQEAARALASVIQGSSTRDKSSFLVSVTRHLRIL